MPGLERRDLLAGQRRPQADRVLALDAVARMEHPVGPRAVVGQDEQALGVLVEPADRVEPAALGEQRGRDHVEDGLRGVAVADRRRHAGRLVEQQVFGRRGGADDPAVDGDDRLVGVDLHAEPWRACRRP